MLARGLVPHEHAEQSAAVTHGVAQGWAEAEVKAENRLIFHIADAGQWAAAAPSGAYEQSTRGLSLGRVGFIHCSTWEQVVPTAHLIYAEVVQPLVVLEIDVEALAEAGVEVRWESGQPDEALSPLFPHIYGALPTACVSRVLAASFDAEGAFAVSVGG